MCGALLSSELLELKKKKSNIEQLFSDLVWVEKLYC